MKTDYAQLTERALLDCLPDMNCRERVLIESMKYSLEAGGKRVRPRLVYEFSRLCGGSEDAAAPFACAVEMIHTYSLIHDDLPCMDDDDLRRGKPSNHRVYGEDIALLAGDALLTLAFETIASDRAAVLCGDRACRLAAKTLAEYAGATGMVGGQVIDLKSENINAPLEVLREMDYKKTACLIKASCELGCIAADADDGQREAARAVPAPHGEEVQVVRQKPLAEDDKHEVADAHSGDGQHHDRTVQDAVLKRAGDHRQHDPEQELAEEDREHDHEGGHHAAPQLAADGFVREERVAEIEEAHIREFRGERDELLDGVQRL